MATTACGLAMPRIARPQDTRVVRFIPQVDLPLFDLLARRCAGINVDVKATDWRSVIQRQASKEPGPGAGSRAC